MKKRILPLLLILLLSLTACGNQKDTMSISVSGFSEETQEVLALFSDELMFFDYRTDDTVQSVSIDLWSCTDGEWASAGKVSGAMNGESTRLGLRLNEYACDLYQTEGSGYTKSSYPSPVDFSAAQTAASSRLTSPTRIELNREIPLWVKWGSSQSALKTEGIENFRDVSCDLGIAVTITFSDQAAE